jgi:hypothetical protein
MDALSRNGGARRDAKERSTLIAAYQEGLGLAVIVAACGAAGIGVSACAPGHAGANSTAQTATIRWWCRRPSDAERVCAAATRRLRRLRLCDETSHRSAGDARSAGNPAATQALAAEAVTAVAKRLGVALYSDEEITADAEAVILRVEEEIEAMRLAGDFKSVNRSYRAYRMEAAAAGEKVVPYAQWFNKYKAKLVRELAGALRYA